MVDSVVAGAAHLADRPDTGSLYDDVIAWATDLFEYFLDPAGWTAVRITVDAVAGTAILDDIRQRVTQPLIETSTTIFRRALRRGEIGTEVAALDVAECLFGAVLMHVMNLPPAARRTAKTHACEHVQPLAHIVLRGIDAQLPGEG